MTGRILTNRPFAVSAVGDLVIIEVGNVPFKLEHEVAIRLATWIMIEARHARRIAGMARRVQMFGVLHNATPDRKPPTERRTKSIDWLKAHQISVKNVGSMVAVTMQGKVLSLPHNEASKVAQWIRVHGKIAKARAKDPRHWSDIGNAEAVEVGENPLSPWALGI